MGPADAVLTFAFNIDAAFVFHGSGLRFVLLVLQVLSFLPPDLRG